MQVIHCEVSIIDTKPLLPNAIEDVVLLATS
jgi:hypothetical protein